MKNEICSEMLRFIDRGTECFHTVNAIKEELLQNGFKELFENDSEKLIKGGKYFITRNMSSVVAFIMPENDISGFNIVASHSDNPSFKLKTLDTTGVNGVYSIIPVEKYGGMSYASWLDRPLGISGRVVVKSENGVKSELVSFDKNVIIPSVAIHMNRKLNEGVALNPAKDLLPLFSLKENSELIKSVGSKGEIIGTDLYLHNAQSGCYVGAEDEFILSPRLDDLECVFTSLKAFTECKCGSAVPVLCVLDNEEVGSQTKQGAESGFLHDTLEMIAEKSDSALSFRALLANSFMVSADNAHALHPEHPELADAKEYPVLNGGVVIKHNADQRYTTDAVSCALFSEICTRAGVKVQHYSNRADIPGGSTLGSIADTKVSINTVDIGLAQLAMHSCMESAGADDVAQMYGALKEFYSHAIYKINDGEYRID